MKTTHAIKAGIPERRPPPSHKGYLKPAGTIRSRVTYNITANSFGYLVRLANRLILPPLFLRAWGATIYGEWLFIASCTALLQLSDLGTRYFVMNRLTFLLSAGKRKKFVELLNTGLLLNLLLSVGVSIVLFVGLYELGPNAIFRSPQLQGAPGYYLCVTFALWQIGQGLQTFFVGVYRALGLGHRGTLFANSSEVLAILGMTILLLAKGNINQVSFVQAISVVGVTLYCALDLEKNLGGVRLISPANWKKGRAFFWILLSFQHFMYQAAQLLYVYAPIILVGWVFDSASIALFGTLRTLGNAVTSLLGAASVATGDEFARLWAIRNQRGLVHLTILTDRGVVLSSLLVTALLHLAGKFIHHYWLGGKVEFNQPAFDLLLINVFLNSYGNLYRQFLSSINKVQWIAAWSLLSIFVGLIASYFLGKRFGMVGVFSAWLGVEFLFQSWFAPYLLSRLIPNFPVQRMALEATAMTLVIGLAFFYTRFLYLLFSAGILFYVRSLMRNQSSSVRVSLK